MWAVGRATEQHQQMSVFIDFTSFPVGMGQSYTLDKNTVNLPLSIVGLCQVARCRKIWYAIGREGGIAREAVPSPYLPVRLQE